MLWLISSGPASRKTEIKEAVVIYAPIWNQVNGFYNNNAPMDVYLSHAFPFILSPKSRFLAADRR